MPMSSSEIAALNGGFQGMAMDQRAYASMIGQPSGLYGASQGASSAGEHLMGHAMSRASAIGAPLLMGGMALAGFDPLSFGVKAGMAAHGAGMGIAGSIGVGAGVMAPLAIGMAAAGYAGNQMMRGADQQMQLNNVLRSSFNFQNKEGGQGFNRSDMTQIGGVVRQMTEQFGPGGEVTNFRELTNLTAKMGQMGLAQGVRDVQEFSKRFKETVTHLKTMAKDLGTTLEGAMDFAQQAKGSGIFGMSNAASFAAKVRGTSVSGGGSVSGIMAVAGVGSQIARGIGGLGSQGAEAGRLAMEQIQTAKRIGVLSESDIYNVTGMGGEEGEQAYAASQMQDSARFLQSSRGRRVIASLATRDGKLDQGSVQQLLSGGMTLNQTVSKDKQNLAKIGRWNFVNNEGRLRGEALAQLGPYLPAQQMMSWLSDKGIEVDQMDDKSMLIAQRQLGWNRDKVEQAVKMVKNLPTVQHETRLALEKDTYAQEYAQRKKGLGLEGLKNKFEQATETVNGKLAKIGQDFFSEGAEKIERFFNKLTDQYVQVMSEDAEKAYRTASHMGALGDAESRHFSGGLPARLRSVAHENMLGLGSAQKTSVAAFMAGGDPHGHSGVLGVRAGETFFGQLIGDAGFGKESDFSKYTEAGFGRKVSSQTAAGLQKNLAEINETQSAIGGPPSADLVALGKSNAPWMADFYSTSLLGMKGTARVDAFGKELLRQSQLADPRSDTAALGLKWSQSDDVGRARIMSGLEPGANIPAEALLRSNYAAPQRESVFGRHFGTEGEREEAFANAFLGKDTSTSAAGMWAGGGVGGASGAVIGAGIGALVGGVGAVPGAAIGWGVGLIGGAVAGENFMSGDADFRHALGKKLGDREYQNLVKRVFSSDSEVRDKAILEVQNQQMALTNKTDDISKANIFANESLRATSDLQQGKSTEYILDKYKSLGEHGYTNRSQLNYLFNQMSDVAAHVQGEDTLSVARSRVSAGLKERALIEKGGLATFSGGVVTLSDASKDAMKGIKGGEELMLAAFQSTATEAGLDTLDANAAGVGLTAASAQDRNFEVQLSKMALADKRKFAAVMGGTSKGFIAQEAAATEDRILRARKHGAEGVGQGAAALGFSLSKADKIALKSGKLTREEKENLILKGLDVGAGVASKDLRAQIGQLVDTAGGTTGVGAGHSIKADSGRAAGYAAGIQDDDQVVAARKATRDKSDAAKDPFGAKTVDLLTSMPSRIAGALEQRVLQVVITKPAEAPKGGTAVGGHASESAGATGGANVGTVDGGVTG